MAKNLPVRFPTEESVKQALKINSFRELSKDKIMQFASMIPYMDKEVAIAVINQFPTYVEFVQTILSFYKDITQKILEDNKESQTAVIHGYQTILDALVEKLKIAPTEDERKAITVDMVSVADKIAEVDYRNKKLLEKILKGVGLFLLGAVAVVGAGIGISSSMGNGGDLPQIDDNNEDDEQ